MNYYKKAILLVGSPKGKDSSSASLGGYLLKKIEEYEIEVETVHIHSEISTEVKTIKFFEKLQKSDYIILVAPLYVDTLPAKVIKALNLIAENKDKINNDLNNEYTQITFKRKNGMEAIYINKIGLISID